MSVNLCEIVASSALGLDQPRLSLVQPDLVIDEFDAWTNPDAAMAQFSGICLSPPPAVTREIAVS